MKNSNVNVLEPRLACESCFSFHQGNMYNGAWGLPWSLYLQINEWFLEEGSNESLFAAAFAKTTCNLVCRGNNMSQIYTKPLAWEQDCFGIHFCHEKAHQDGGDATKKLPRHCYSNPLNRNPGKSVNLRTIARVF